MKLIAREGVIAKEISIPQKKPRALHRDNGKEDLKALQELANSFFTGSRA